MTARHQKNCSQVQFGPPSTRQHFNYLRNNSSSVYGIFTWQPNNSQVPEEHTIQANYDIPHQQHNYERPNTNKKVTFNQPQQKNKNNQKFNASAMDTNYTENFKASNNNKKPIIQLSNQSARRPQSAPKISKISQQQAEKAAQNRRKVLEHIQQMRPYTRQFPNSKFQEYYGRAAMQTYGRVNTNEPIGGIIYGNHMKTFNINPHSYTNQPQYYQTHTTALNFGKRTKLNDEARLKLLEKQLTKKLGLLDKNQSLKEGKQVVYVDVDDNNMYDVMRQNLEFKKAHRQEIRDQEKQNQKQRQDEKKAKVQQFYAEKQNKLENNLANLTNKSMNLNTTMGSVGQENNQKDRINQQVVYRYYDEKGNVRLATDRHGITCFVDMNFPENDAAYTEQLKNRMPIFPIPTKQQDKNLDNIRRENYKKSLDNIYPSHYLLPNCQQPEILKMLKEKVTQTTSPGGIKGKSFKKSPHYGQKKIQKQTQRIPVQQGTNLSQRFSPRKPQQDNQRSSHKNPHHNQYTHQSQINKPNHDNNYGRPNHGDELGYAPAENQMKNNVLNEAWRKPAMAQSLLNPPRVNCINNHDLSNNEKDPYWYKNASGNINKVPIAGKSSN